MNDKIQFDLVVVGAGMSGSTAAAIAARAGLNVAVIERGQKPGAKNYFGGALYTHALEDIYPDFFDRKPPLERPVTETGFWFLSEDGMVKATVRAVILIMILLTLTSLYGQNLTPGGQNRLLLKVPFTFLKPWLLISYTKTIR